MSDKKKTPKNHEAKQKNKSQDIALIDELADAMVHHQLTSLSYANKDVSIEMTRGGVAMPAPMPAPVAAAVPPTPQDTPASPEGTAVTAPLVGTIYIAPEPGAPPFVTEGSAVKSGQTLLIVEAMKTMNPVTAPHDGTVGRILVTDGEPVEYGQTLLIIT